MQQSDEQLLIAVTVFFGSVVGAALIALVDWAAALLSQIHV